MQLLRSLVFGASLATLAIAGFAGSSSAFFEVRIVLHNPLAPGDGGNLPLPPPSNPTSGGGGGGIPGTPPVAPVAPTSGICTSQSHSDATNATVRVLCSNGQFVSIEPAPGRPFAGTHGGAFRYQFGPGHNVAIGDPAAIHIGAGTVTALRIVSLHGSRAPLEMLVSF